MPFNYQLLLITKDINLALKLDEALKMPAPQSYSLYIAQSAGEAQKDLHVRNFDAVIADPASLKLNDSLVISTVKKIKAESAIILIGDNFASETELNAAYALGAQLCVIKEALNAEELVKNLNLAILRQKHLNSALKDAEKAIAAKSQFLAVMSHEIKTPMTSIIGMSELLQKTELNAEQLEYADIIHKSCEHLFKIINDILDISKLESGKLIISQNPFYIEDLVKSVHAMLLIKAQDKKIKFAYSTAPDTKDKFIGDPFRIMQVLINLCSNAIKYTNEGGATIVVKAISSKQDTVKLYFEVSDTGIGMAPEKQKEIFMPYYQIEDRGLIKNEGHGLGLVISKKLIELMNGNLYFESCLDKGSKFWFIIELKKSAGETSENISAANLKQENKAVTPKCLQDFVFDENFSVLITEDNAFNQKLIQSFLIKRGINKIETAFNGEECVKIRRQKNISAVIMDCQMPVMDGITASVLIREYEKLSARPPCLIIALTADTLNGTREKCIKAGMDDYLTKPIDFDSLYCKLTAFSSMAGKKTPAEIPLNKAGAAALENKESVKNETGDLIFNAQLISELKKLQLPGKPDIISQLFDIYLKETGGKIETLKNAIRSRNAETIKQVAHNLKSSTANVGGIKLSSIFKSLENMAKNNDLDNLDAFIDEIDSNYELLKDKLNQLLDHKEL